MIGIELGRDVSRIAVIGADGPRVVATGKPGIPPDPATKLDPAATTEILRALAAQLSSTGPVVVAVPAWYNDEQRRTVAEATRAAGLSLFRLVNEGVAAALDHCFVARSDQHRMIVMDVGPSAVEITVLEIRSNGFELLAADGAAAESTAAEAAVRRALGTAGCPVSAIDAMLLVGSNPGRRDLGHGLGERLGLNVVEPAHPEEAVARGAAVYSSLARLAPDPSLAQGPAPTGSSDGGCLVLLAALGGLMALLT